MSDPMSPEELQKERQAERSYWEAEAKTNLVTGFLWGVFASVVIFLVFF